MFLGHLSDRVDGGRFLTGRPRPSLGAKYGATHISAEVAIPPISQAQNETPMRGREGYQAYP